jgi:hypothetical protein
MSEKIYLFKCFKTDYLGKTIKGSDHWLLYSYSDLTNGTVVFKVIRERSWGWDQYNSIIHLESCIDNINKEMSEDQSLRLGLLEVGGVGFRQIVYWTSKYWV